MKDSRRDTADMPYPFLRAQDCHPDSMFQFHFPFLSVRESPTWAFPEAALSALQQMPEKVGGIGRQQGEVGKEGLFCFKIPFPEGGRLLRRLSAGRDISGRGGCRRISGRLLTGGSIPAFAGSSPAGGMRKRGLPEKEGSKAFLLQSGFTGA